MRTTYISVVAAILLTTRVVSAQDPPMSLECSEFVPAEEQSDAKRLALRGVACFEAENYLLALRHYRRARELSDANLLNAALGRTFQELGYPFIAKRYYRDYLKGKIEESDGRAKIEARLADVDAQLESGARIRLESSPPGAKLYVVIEGTHWEELGEAPMDLRMRAGKHSFVAERKGYVTHTAQVDVGSKQSRIVRAELVEEGAAFAVAGLRLRRSGIIAMAASVPFLVLGPSLYFIGRNTRSSVDELPAADRPEQTRSGLRMQNWGIVTTVVGAAALGTGLTMYLVGRDADTPDEGQPSGDPKSSKKKTSMRWFPYTDGRTTGVLVAY